MLLTLVGCGQISEAIKDHRRQEHEAYDSPEPDPLVFSSFEDLLSGYELARNGDFTNLASQRGATGSALADIVESTNFTELEKLYLPTGLPMPYQLYKISVYDKCISICFMHEDDMVSDEAIQSAFSQFKFFGCDYYYWDSDSPLDGTLRQHGATEKNLIDGKYLFDGRHSLCWAIDRGAMYMYLPLPSRDVRDKISMLENLGLNSIEELVKFAEVEVINLID